MAGKGTSNSPTTSGGPAEQRRERRRQRRAARFSRPPAPRDWRWAVSGVGRVFVSVGVLMFAFVAYQLWGTGLSTAQAQDDLEAAFEQLIATTPTSTAAPTTTLADVATPTTAPTATTTTAPPPPPPPVPAPPRGEPLARIEIPAIGVDKIVVEGVRYSDLRKGPGHFPETPLPGQFGNAAIAGHRTTYGQPFVDIDRVQLGDDIVITASWGSRYVYTVDDILIVQPADYAQVIPTVDPTTATLTLVSCNPKYSARERYIVKATIDTARSDQVTLAGTPGEPDLAPLATTTTTTTAAAGTSTTVAAEVSTTTALPPDTVAPTTAPTGGSGSTGGSGGEAGEDVFSSKWFDDPDAYPLVAFWGLVLTALALLATSLSRRVMRNWVGLVVGIIPFTVALYFFFAAISRLMPANL